MSSINVPKKPADTDFKQQRLRAWQPLLTPRWVIGIFASTGLLFIIIGLILTMVASGIYEQVIPYTDECADTAIGGTCVVSATISEDIEGPIFFYYRLTNFYQNHRRYVKSRSDKQLRGEEDDLDSCDPLKISSATNNEGGKLLYPCGLIASSYFNDDISASIVSEDGQQDTSLAWSKDNIIWGSDRNKFKIGNFDYNTDKYTRETRRGERDITLPEVTDEDLIVWMRTAGLPTFKKLYRISDQSIAKGSQIKFTIENNFEVASFGGTKSIVIGTTSFLGGKNAFLQWAYLIVGILCLLTALGFAIKDFTNPRQLGDLSYWEKNHAH